MESSVLTSLSLAFMAAGLTLLLTSLALSRRARRYQLGMQALLQLSNSPLDILDLPAAAWPTLQAAGWRSLHWSGDWYGQPVQGIWGADQRTDGDSDLSTSVGLDNGQQSWEISGGQEARLVVRLTHAARRGEQRLFANHLAQVFVLLLETRLRERTGALSAALAERARLSLYLQHDMRNLAQWVAWVSADFAHATDPPALLTVAQRLQVNAPLALERAQRLMTALGKNKQNDQPAPVNLRDALAQAARLAGIEIEITGDVTAWIAPDNLERALDNLLSNLAAEWREGKVAPPQAVLYTLPVSLGETQNTQSRVTLVLALPSGGLRLQPEKLFEPFASGRPGGLGLGLYQARKCLQDADGDLHATVLGSELRFEIQIPQNEEKLAFLPHKQNKGSKA